MTQVSGDDVLGRLGALGVRLSALVAQDQLAMAPAALRAEVEASVRDAVAVLCPGVAPGAVPASSEREPPSPIRCSDLLLSVELLQGAMAENEQ